MSEVLTSVQRTEESLRKFKKIRDPSNIDFKQNTDDDKIRLQLQIDIQHYLDAVSKVILHIVPPSYFAIKIVIYFTGQ